MGSDVVVKVDHGVDSLILHWVVVSEHDLEVDALGELSVGLVGKNFVDVGLELVLVELSTGGQGLRRRALTTFLGFPLLFFKPWIQMASGRPDFFRSQVPNNKRKMLNYFLRGKVAKKNIPKCRS